MGLLKSTVLLLMIWKQLCLQTRGNLLFNAQDEAFLLSESTDRQTLERHSRSVDPLISSMHVTSVVMSRFARVTIVSTMVNELNVSSDLTFSVRLPEAAFITELQMSVMGITFVGKVKEKEVAEQQFDKAVQGGNTAGLVTADVRKTQTFNVATNVSPQSSVTFELVYQELLKRKLGEYDHVIMVDPRQVVDDLVVNVYITEKIGITSLSTKMSGTGEREKIGRGYEGHSEIEVDSEIRRSKYQAKVTFKPTKEQQKRLQKIPEDERKFGVRYDVTRESLGGEIQTRNGYFVHFFAPENLPIMPKNVVFVIDRSGSMYGRKMDQTKNAFQTVLSELRAIDKFNIVSFAGGISVWGESDLVYATTENVKTAITYVQTMNADGLTNFNGAILRGVKLLEHVKMENESSSMIIMLSDGDPTAGVTDTSQIRYNVKRAVDGRYSVFCLGFGEYLNHNFLKRLANENDGISRKIYEDSDAELQLEGFFREVATPLLLHVKMTYSGSKVAKVSTSSFDKFFSGSEVVIVGVVQGNEKELKSLIEGTSSNGDVRYSVKSSPIDNSFQHWFQDTGDSDDFIERIWAYFTIKELLKKKELSESRGESQKIDSRVISLSLKYNFVTSLTSMIVTLPEDEITETGTPTEFPETGNTTTEYPPIPPCFLRGQSIPGYIIDPIRCPYILREDEITGVEDDEMDHVVSGITSTPQFITHPVPLPSFSPKRTPTKPSKANRARSGRRISKPATTTTTRNPRRRPAATMTTTTTLPTRRPSTRAPGTTMPHQSMTIPTTIPITVTPEECNKQLVVPNARIEPIKSRLNFTECEWNIVLNDDAWIVVLLERIGSSRDNVTITSNNKTVFTNYDGAIPGKHVMIPNNEIIIRMTLSPGQATDSTFVISYSEYMFNRSQANCGHVIDPSDNRRGFITSPDYPMRYPGNSRCLWNIMNSSSIKLNVRISMIELDIETDGESKCTHDMVVVMNGRDDHRVVCGYETQNSTWEVDADSVAIAFWSDDEYESGGFKLAYEFTDQDV